jgi:ferric-dicitrate binding protein FerR (iron transport regulator)
MSEETNRYLWDGSGPADPAVEQLETALSRFRYVARPLAWERAAAPRARGSWFRGWRLATGAAFAAAAVILAAFLAVRSRLEWTPGAPWKVNAVAGAPQVESNRIVDGAQLAVGQALETDAASRARLRIGGIGVLDVAPNSRVRLLATGEKRHRVALDYGTIEAHTWAPPFSFAVDTPSSALFDLGCSFTLHVDKDGYGTVHVDQQEPRR